jgi:hypothetical protein
MALLVFHSLLFSFAWLARSLPREHLLWSRLRGSRVVALKDMEKWEGGIGKEMDMDMDMDHSLSSRNKDENTSTCISIFKTFA